MNYTIPESITINNKTFYFKDCTTPETANSYLKLLESLQTYEPGIIA